MRPTHPDPVPYPDLTDALLAGATAVLVFDPADPGFYAWLPARADPDPARFYAGMLPVALGPADREGQLADLRRRLDALRGAPPTDPPPRVYPRLPD